MSGSLDQGVDLEDSSQVTVSIGEAAKEFETEVVMLNKSSEQISFEQELVTDMIELVTVFSARLYGSRSKKNKKLVDGIAKVVDEVK